MEDIKGCLHNHSTYSDGASTLKDMAKACIDMGLQYLGMCDHSKSAFYAGGLSIEEVVRQQSEIDSLDLSFQCSKFPCVSPGGRVRATLKMKISNQNREVKAEAEEYISPWQWNGIALPELPSIKIDL